MQECLITAKLIERAPVTDLHTATDLPARSAPTSGPGQTIGETAGQTNGQTNGQINGQTGAQHALATLIVSALQLEVAPAAIDPAAPMFGEGLGLDSIDALELALAISRAYGFELRSDDERNQRIFASLRTLADHVEANRTR